MLKKFKFFFIFIAVIFLALILFAISYWRGISAPLNEKGRDKIFIVLKGESVKDIAENLYNAELIGSRIYFEIYIWWNKKEKELQAGEYVLNPRMSVKEIADILSGGKIISNEMEIKIIEGWRLKDINDYLVQNDILKDNSFLDLASSKIGNQQSAIGNRDFLSDAPPSATLEGYLFPDTYRIFKDAGAENIIEKMLENFGRKLSEKMRADIKSQGRSTYSIITMASLIEKEVRSKDDMKIAAGIFWDRIKTDQALQSDATLSYALDDKKISHIADELKIDSPYNTYKYKGLPPTPICNPGLNAITAAIYPSYTDYNYFLTKPDTGEAVFSKTYEEHLKNKSRYLLE